MRQGWLLLPFYLTRILLARFTNGSGIYRRILYSLFISTLIFADKQIIFTSSVDDLQRAVRLLSKVANKYNCVVSILKTNVGGFIADELRRAKVVLSDKTSELILLSRM